MSRPEPTRLGKTSARGRVAPAGLVWMVLCSAAGAAEPAALDVARKVQERYDQTQDFAAEFSQEMRLSAGGHVVESSGRMYFEKPGRMRWEYMEPEPQTIVADGQTLWIHQPEEKQVLKAPLEDAFHSRTPVSFLLGVARLERDFAPALVEGGAEEHAAGGLHLRLDPRDRSQGDLGVLVLEIDPESYDIRAATIRDPLGNVTRVELREVRRNRGIDAEKFRFVRPPGTDVIQSPGS